MSSSKNAVTPSTVSTSTERLLGRVKWFNSKAGYGFITVTDGESSGSDIFVHHSAINVENQQYRYLVQGEYVEFSLLATPNSNHEFQASVVCGIKAGKLMCETRREFKIARNNYKSSNVNSSRPNSDSSTGQRVEQNVTQRQQRTHAPRVRVREETSEWNLVQKDNTKPQNSTPQPRQVDNRPRRGRPSKISQH